MSVEVYREQFAAARDVLAGAGLDWLADLRGRAFDQFARDGFPSAKVEEWKYANLGPLTKTDYRLAGDHADTFDAALTMAAMPAESHRIVFVNGRLRDDLSGLGDLPAGVTVTGLARLAADDPDLLQRCLTVVHLGPEAAAELPIHVVHLAAPTGADEMIQSRNLIVAEQGSAALIVETHAAAGHGGYFNNAVTQVFAAKDAHVRHYRLQAEALDAFHIATTLAHLGDAAAYDSFVLSLGAAFARNEIRATLDGEHVHCRLNGAYLGRGTQHLDNWTRVDHLKPYGTVSEAYKSVLDDSARGAFQGKIRVWPGADKTDAKQLNNNLLLSAKAQADSKPELEILADDVRCAHGTTVGDIDDEALFYLRTRGIDADRARDLLIEAFIGDLIDHIGYGTAQDYFRAAATGWLSRLHEEPAA
jgi:Fe-S cluster assembly protein SufD